jgi:hypothetical protein
VNYALQTAFSGRLPPEKAALTIIAKSYNLAIEHTSDRSLPELKAVTLNRPGECPYADDGIFRSQRALAAGVQKFMPANAIEGEDLNRIGPKCQMETFLFPPAPLPHIQEGDWNIVRYLYH